MATAYDPFAAPPTDAMASRWREWLQGALAQNGGGTGGNTFNWSAQKAQAGEPLRPGDPGYVTSDGKAPGTTTGTAAPQGPAPGTTGAGWTVAQKTGTAGRTGASYDAFLAANPGFDPWSNLDQYAGAGAGNDPILAQAFGWTNQWARDNHYADGSQIPLAQRQQVFLANLERARQQWADYAVDGQSHPGAITWEQSAASRIPNSGWSYQAGSGLHGGAQPAPASNNGTAAALAPPPPPPPPPAPGGPPPAPGATGGNGSGSVGYNTQMASDKAFRMAQLLDTMGLGDPNRQHSYVGSSLANTYTQLFDPWTKTQGLDGSDTQDNWNGMMQDFQRKVQGPNGFAALGNDANAALQRLPGLAGNLDDSELMGLTANFNQLRNMPLNPVMQRYYGNVQDDSFGQFLSQLGQIQRGQGDAAAASFRYLPFIQNDPRFRQLMGQG